MTTHHFAGLNTAQFAQVLEGQDVLISYADIVRRPGVWTNEILPRLQVCAYASVILDSGAFTELSDEMNNERRAAKGLEPKPVFHCDLEAYGQFALDHRDLFDVIVNLDDIRGNLARSQANQSYLEGLGLDVLPVFHQGEPWAELEALLAKHDYIGVGFQRPITGAEEFLAQFFARTLGVKVHGFGMTSWADQFPFTTVDSTTWISEYLSVQYGAKPHGPRTCPRIKAWAKRVGRDGVAQMVVDSYQGRVAGVPEGDLELCRGQARTVLARAGAFEPVQLELLAA